MYLVDFLAYFVIVPVLVAVFLFVFMSDKATKILAILFQMLFLGFAAYLMFLTQDGSMIQYVGSTNDFLSIVLYLNTFSSVFIVLTGVLFLVVAFYSFNQDNSRLFWLLLFIWQAVLVGIFLVRDLFNIFVMMEVAGIIVTMLILFKRKERSMYEGIFYLMANLVAVGFYLFGLGYLYRLTGHLDMVIITGHIADLAANGMASEFYLPYALIMTGIAFKCALVPMSIWVPKAHGSPGAHTAVSAILSGLYIKCAVYLFIRFQEMFAPVANHTFFLILGAVTAMAGTVMAMSNSNAKVILAYHTVSQVGLIILGLSAGANNEYAMLGGLYHIVAHALFKSALFLTAGIIKRSYGTLDVYKVRGAFKRMPLVGVAMGIAILGITGAPFFIGSVSKYYIGYGADEWFVWLIRIISLATIIHFIKYGSMLFGKDPGYKGDEVKPDKWRVTSSLLWAGLCLLGGLFGPQAINVMFGGMVEYASANTSLLTTFVSDGWLGGYYDKALWWVGSCIVGYFIFIYAVKGNKHLKKLSKLDMGFKAIVGSQIVFFGALLFVVGVL
ncbi:MAG: hypothetical protein FWC67_01895 [Defluviitaleaceae bacterium]|nr:hypothetical protein [Defluviitaleaceae bacterium]